MVVGSLGQSILGVLVVCEVTFYEVASLGPGHLQAMGQVGVSAYVMMCYNT